MTMLTHATDIDLDALVEELLALDLEVDRPSGDAGDPVVCGCVTCFPGDNCTPGNGGGGSGSCFPNCFNGGMTIT